MNITKEQNDPLVTRVKIDIDEVDYKQDVNNKIKKYAKTASLPGFRKGHVPFGIIEKKYGHALKVEKIDTLISKGLSDFIKEEKLDVFGSPVPANNENVDLSQTNLSFEFDFGMKPDINIDIEKVSGIKSYEVKITKEDIDEEIESIRKIFGKFSESEIVANDSMIKLKLEIEEKRIEIPSAVLNLVKCNSKKIKEIFIGKSKGDKGTFKLKDFYKRDKKILEELNLRLREQEGKKLVAKFVISEVYDVEPVEVNDELKRRVIGPEKELTEENFNVAVEDILKAKIESEKDNKLMRSIDEFFEKNLKFKLPKEFLDKLFVQNLKEELEENDKKEFFESSEKMLRYKLIENKIIEKHDLEIKGDELIEYVKESVKAHYKQYGVDLDGDQLNYQVQDQLKDENTIYRYKENLVGRKLLSLYKDKVKFKIKKLSYTQFLNE